MRKLETLEIFEWYDGIVTAVVRPSWTREAFLASALTWSQPKKLRVFGLVPLTGDQMSTLRARGMSNWDEFIGTLREFSRNGADDGLLVRVDESTGDVTGVATVRRAEIAGEMIAGIEHALEPSTARWLVEPDWS